MKIKAWDLRYAKIVKYRNVDWVWKVIKNKVFFENIITGEKLRPCDLAKRILDRDYTIIPF